MSGWPSSLRHVAPDQRSPLPCRASIRRQAPSSPNLAHCCACSPLDLPLPGHMHIEFCTFRRRQTVKHGPREEWSCFRTHRHQLREGRLWPGRILWSARRQRRAFSFFGPTLLDGTMACRRHQQRMDRRRHRLRGRRYPPAGNVRRPGGGQRHRLLRPGRQTPTACKPGYSVGRLWGVVRRARCPLVGNPRSRTDPWDAASRCCCCCSSGRTGARRASSGQAMGTCSPRSDTGSAHAVDSCVRCARYSGQRRPCVNDSPPSTPVVQRRVDPLCGLAQRSHA